MKEIKVLMLSKREHCSQILTGLLMLESGGRGGGVLRKNL